MCMFKPETTFTGFGNFVIVLTEDGYAFGQYTGNSRESSESYEIRVEETMTGNEYTEYFHYEDIFKSSEENLERVREMI
jgi:hypothetical protein